MGLLDKLNVFFKDEDGKDKNSSILKDADGKDYSSIAKDVEQGLAEDSSPLLEAENTSSPPPVGEGETSSPPQTLEEKYPEANEDERAFLGALDDAIAECSHPEVSLPKFDAEQENTPVPVLAFLDSLFFPTMSLLISIGVGFSVMIANCPLYKLSYPYISCFIAFIATIPPVRKRYLTQAGFLFNKINSQDEAVETQIVGLSKAALEKVGDAEARLEAPLSPIKSKLDKMTEMEQFLRKVDPAIDIPDVKDIEEAFDGCSDKIEGVVQKAVQLVQSSSTEVAPAPLKSLSHLSKFIFYPFLVILLVIQVCGIYASKAGASDAEITQTDIIMVSFQTYLTAVCELIVMYLASNLAILGWNINEIISKIESKVNVVVKKEVGEVFSSVFEKGLGAVHDKFLKLVKDVEQMEGPMKKALDMQKLELKMKLLEEKAIADAAEEKAKKEAERIAREAQEKAEEEVKEKMGFMMKIKEKLQI